jgi:Uma2 family endonuclease
MAIVTNARTRLTYGDYAQFPADGRRHEVIDGEHIVTPAPDTYHQKLSRRIQFQLYGAIEEKGLGEVFNAPTDLQLSETDVVQPDLIVVLAANLQIITPKKIKGKPDLVVEILSPATAAVDRSLKRELYQKAGVPEYWLVDPDDHTLEQYVLDRGAYRLEGKHAEAVTFSRLADVRVDLTRVW